MRGYGTRTLALCVAVGLIGLVPPSSASAAAGIGETFVPNITGGGATNTLLQTASPNGQYTLPSDGVITSWSFEAEPTDLPELKFKVARPAGGNNYTIVGESAQAATTPGFNTFPTQIPALAGDVIGFSYPVDGFFARGVPGGAGYVVRFISGGGDPPPGSTTDFNQSTPAAQLDVSAILEPDADGDGFGDETQDQCPTDASKQGDCAPPETTITKHPKDKTKKKQATFEFTSSEPGSTFLCSFDGDPFAACTSPESERVGKGKHAFDVVAVDPAGNTDATPGEDSWRVKKKKKR